MHNVTQAFCPLSSHANHLYKEVFSRISNVEPCVYQNHVPHAYMGYGCYSENLAGLSAYSNDLLIKQKLS